MIIFPEMVKRFLDRRFLLSLVLLWLGAAQAHDLPVNRMVNALIRVQGGQAELIARVPMDLLRGIPFPTSAGRYDVSQAGPFLELADLLLVDSILLEENGTKLAAIKSEGRMVPASDRSFDQFNHALMAMNAPPDNRAVIPFDTGYLDLHLIYPVGSARSRFEIQSQIAVDVGVLAPLTVRFQREEEAGRAMIIQGGADPVDLDPVWYRAAAGFVVMGVEHILSGTDHLLFLLCLVVPVRRLRDIVPVITAFTIAHSLTLIASAMGVAPRGAWFPPVVEASIAASIVYTGIENIAAPVVGRRWLISCLFGLIHGFGFSNALGDSLQFAGKHLLVSLLAFNVGIELGQLGVLCVGMPILLLLRHWFSARSVVVAFSGLGAVLGGVWLIERWEFLRQLDATCASAFCLNQAVPWLMLVVCATGLMTMISVYVLRRVRHFSPHQGTSP